VDIMGRRIPQTVASTLAGGGGLLALVLGAIQIGAMRPLAFWVTLNMVLWAVLASGVLAWFHGEEGSQKMPTVEKWILGALFMGWIASTVILVTSIGG
jgi:hypothetical protein